jgi:hypothetical protein
MDIAEVSDLRGADVEELARDVPGAVLAELGVRRALEILPPQFAEIGTAWMLFRTDLKQLHESDWEELTAGWFFRKPFLTRLDLLAAAENGLAPLVRKLREARPLGIFVRARRPPSPPRFVFPYRVWGPYGLVGQFISRMGSSAEAFDVRSAAGDCELALLPARGAMAVADGAGPHVGAAVVLVIDEEGASFDDRRRPALWERFSASAVGVLREPSATMLGALGAALGDGVPLDVALAGGYGLENIQDIDAVLESSRRFLDAFSSAGRYGGGPVVGAKARSAREEYKEEPESPEEEEEPPLGSTGEFPAVARPHPPSPSPSPASLPPPRGAARWALGLLESILGSVGRGFSSFVESKMSVGSPLPPPTEPRFLQASLFKADGREVKAKQALVRSSSYRLEGLIGPAKVRELVSPLQLDERGLPPGAVDLWLAFVPGSGPTPPAIEKLTLPTSGQSKSVCFTFETPGEEGAFDARLVVLHENRVLQTLRLTAWVAATEKLPRKGLAMALEREAVLETDFAALHESPPLAGALVVNHDARGAPAMTRFQDRTAVRFSLENMSGYIKLMDEQLAKLAAGGSLDQPDAAASLRALARHSVHIFDFLRNELHLKLPRTGENLQVIAAHRYARFPIETVYDREPPVLTATLCTNAQAALQKGECSASCATNENVVCPLGFWGVRFTFERHVVDPKLESEERRVKFASSRAEKLDLPLDALVGCSQQITGAEAKLVVEHLTKKLQPKTVGLAGSWKQWAKLVQERQPGLMVLLAHAEEDADDEVALEISGDRIGLISVGDKYLGRSPIVLLLSCKQGESLVPFQGAVAWLDRRNVAATIVPSVVIYAPATLKAVEVLVDILLDKGRAGTTLDAAMTELRRTQLWANPMVLSLVAYGRSGLKLAFQETP